MSHRHAQRQFRRWAPSIKLGVPKHGPQPVEIRSGRPFGAQTSRPPMALAIVLFAVGGLLAGRCGDLRGAAPSALWPVQLSIAGEVVDHNA
jgi:hypothetical protein